MQGKYKKIEEWLLFFMILFIPLKSLPARYKLPLLGKNVAVALPDLVAAQQKGIPYSARKICGAFLFLGYLVYQYRSIHISILSRSY